jgi:hypothetical protein
MHCGSLDAQMIQSATCKPAAMPYAVLGVNSSYIHVDIFYELFQETDEV